MNNKFKVEKLADLNSEDIYFLNEDIRTFTPQGVDILPKGSVAKFISVVDEKNVMIFCEDSDFDETLIKVNFSSLSSKNKSVVGKMISFKDGLSVCTENGWADFYDDLFKIVAVFKDQYTNTKQCLVSLVDNEEISSVISFDLIEENMDRLIEN